MMNARALGIAAVIVGIGVGAGAYGMFSATPVDASAIVETCSGEENRERCYERIIPALYPTHRIPELLQIVREVRDLDSSYQFCHVLAHKLGEAVVAEDPSNWLDAIALNPADGLCSNGFVHGVIVGRFRDDVLDDSMVQAAIGDFKKACEPRETWKASPLDQAICYHGLGHLFMFITNADIPRALGVCDAVGTSPTGDFLRVCREGVFMQIYQPLEPDDFALIELLPEKPSAENYRRMCASYAKTSHEEGACLREAWPLFRTEIVSGNGVRAFCAGQPNEEETQACYQTSAAIVGRQSLGHMDAAADACAQFPETWRRLCYVSVAQAIVEEDRTRASRAIEFCGRAAAPLDNECIGELAGRASFIFAQGSSEGKAFCAALPERHRAACRF